MVDWWWLVVTGFASFFMGVGFLLVVDDVARGEITIPPRTKE